jgi:alpha-beta hydrolase superfamily lysophospholipase
MGTAWMNARLSNFQFKGETDEMSDHLRQTVPGKFIKLPPGYTHYELYEPGHGTVAVLVHGFSIPYYIWDTTFEDLKNAGIKVLRYDLYGRGFSDRPNVDYDLELFVKQLISLLRKLGIDGPVDLLGLSMGGQSPYRFVTDIHSWSGNCAFLTRRGCQWFPRS